MRDRQRHKTLQKRKTSSVLGFLEKIFDASSGWILVLMVGISSGLLAGKPMLHVVYNNPLAPLCSRHH